MTEIISKAFFFFRQIPPPSHSCPHTPFLVPLKVLLFLCHFVSLFDFSFCLWFYSLVLSCFGICWIWKRSYFSIDPLSFISLKWLNSITLITCNMQQQAGSLVDLRGPSCWGTCQHVHRRAHARAASLGSQEGFLLRQKPCWNQSRKLKSFPVLCLSRPSTNGLRKSCDLGRL